jgi:glycosyltransferase involved in cell wall biosynthesis
MHRVSELIRVMHIMGHMMGGGVEATGMNHYRHIDRDRVQFDFVVDSDSTVVPREEIETLGGRVFVVPPYKKLPLYSSACEKLFREQKPDIVHSNINALSVFPLRAAKRAGVPIRIAHSHSTANPGEHAKTLVKNVLKPLSKLYPTHLAACSKYSARWLFGDKAVDEDRVHIIKNAIDLDKFSFNPRTRSRKRAELGVTDRQLVIGQVGRMCFQKNQVFTLNVFAEVLKQRPDAVLVFVGDGPMRADVEAKIDMLGIRSNVRQLGVRNDVNELYQAFDVLMFPSTYEGLGMAAVEAQVSGLSVMASDQVPAQAGIIGRLVSFLSLDDASKWVAMLVSTAAVGNRSDEIDEVRSQGYSIDDSAEEMCAWYEHLMATTGVNA